MQTIRCQIDARAYTYDTMTIQGPEEYARYGPRSANGERGEELLTVGPTRIRKARLMVYLRSNPLELWLLVGIDVIIFALIAYVVLS